MDWIALYREIAEYGGNFGDPVIDLVETNPFSLLEELPPDPESLTRVSVAALCWLSSAIDNGGHSFTVAEFGESVDKFIHEGLGCPCSSIRGAFRAFHQSETSFNLALRAVYHEVVLPELEP